MRLLLVMLCMGLGLSACTPMQFLNATISRKGYHIERNIAYGTLARQKLDLYIPDNVNEHTSLIVFFYGGSWRMGSKEEYLFAAQGLVSLGAAVAVPDYRLSPEVEFPDFLYDSARAVAWVHAHAANYGLNANNLYLMGHSAGAYNAAMVALNEEYMQAAGGDTRWIKGVIGLSGPYDFLPMTEAEIIRVFNGNPNNPLTQPIHYVREHAPPMLLLQGLDDTRVYPKNACNLAAALRAKGNAVTLIEYPNVGHAGTIIGMNTSIPWNRKVRADVREFLE